MPKKQDALDFMNDMEAWSTTDMQRTVGKMMRSAELILDAISDEAALAKQCDAKRIRDLSGSLRSVADSIERYTGIYAWCSRQGTTGAHSTALEDVLPLLDNEETLQLHGWMQRLEAHMLDRKGL